MSPSPRGRRLAAACAGLVAVAATAASTAPSALADRPGPAPPLQWSACSDEGVAQCATATVPKDWSKPRRGTLDLAVVRIPATDPDRRIGSLFVNFGGPGGDAASTVEAVGARLFRGVNDRFDIIGMDPRGVGGSRPAIDCRSNQETEGVYAQPFETPDTLDIRAMIQRDTSYIRRCLTLNSAILPYVSTANVARDIDHLRAAVGDDRLTYLGFSYGTFLGATYQSMFPDHVRALVLDGALDPDQYVNDPLSSLDEQTAGFERAIGRFLQACAARQDACLGFGGEDPWSALDELIERAAVTPIPTADGRAVDGEDIDAAVTQAVYSKDLWPDLAYALARAQQDNDGTVLRALVDIFYGRLEDGTYDPLTDRYFTISALEQRYPHDVGTFLREGKRSYQDYDHAFWNHGYGELAWGLYPVKPNSAFYGPFRNPANAPTTLVVGTTYDPATPYKEAKRLVSQLGNARLLTMRGDGHTAYGGNSACIDAAVDAYLEELALPAEGMSCRQEVPFEQPPPEPAATPQGDVAPQSLAQRSGLAQRLERIERLAPHVKPLPLP
ncbi:alpha/beta hydrolase [Conexibacter stalactiti]|uniref:Alpha/beta hydrolase n=1 Tax=Conexibacter stalactiti TaxID=1940611 RepID=A0ABU4HHR6_9ACTN|nr:alpha/beta hydrolase [Conexibacter stalactiti]MDW5592848.1 alpha/beta hydrolase [Conexibacter stalactiti]MEC5033489.1 alpha/beta hydrolase [Conexibacter stalactiti]